MGLTIDKVMELNPPMLDLKNMKASIELLYGENLIFFKLPHKKERSSWTPSESLVEASFSDEGVIVFFFEEHLHFDKEAAHSDFSIDEYINFLARLLSGNVYAIQEFRGTKLLKVTVYDKERPVSTAFYRWLIRLNPFLKKSEKRISINFFE